MVISTSLIEACSSRLPAQVADGSSGLLKKCLHHLLFLESRSFHRSTPFVGDRRSHHLLVLNCSWRHQLPPLSSPFLFSSKPHIFQQGFLECRMSGPTWGNGF